MLNILKKKDVNMHSGNITKGLIAIALPVMVMNVLNSLFNIIDMTMLENFGSDPRAVGAVGVCGSLISLMSNLVIGCATGTNVAVAKRIGARNEEGVKRAVGTSVLFSLCAGLLLTVIGVIFARTFLSWVNCSDELIDAATVYFRLYFAGVPLLMVYNFAAACLRSSGDATRPMLFLTSGGIVKVALTFVFTKFLDLGVEAVAIATIVSWALIACLALGALLKNKGILRLDLRYFRFFKRELLDILHVGIPAGLQMSLYAIANVIITSTVNSYGTAATTGISIANQFDGILYQICVAPSHAVLPYVSQNVGAKNIDRAKKSIWRGVLVTIAIGGVFGALSAIFSPQLSSLMSSDPQVIAYSCEKMVIISSTYFICGISDIMAAAVRGLGKPTIPTVTTLIYMCALRFFWVYVMFPLCPNFTFLYLVWPIGWVLSLVTLLFFLFPTAKRLSKKFEAQKSAVTE